MRLCLFLSALISSVQAQKALRGVADPVSAGAAADVHSYDTNCLKDVDVGGGELGSWESIVECTEWAENYHNPWCEDIKDWQKKFVCGNTDQGDNKTYYRLQDVNGQTEGVITCYIESNQRIIEFPPGRFKLNEQVWVPPMTTVRGHGIPNDAQDKSKFAGGEQTYFFVDVNDGISDKESAISYCIPSDPSNPNPMEVKLWRKGFNLHSNTELSNLIILGGDTYRPDQNGNLCGGGAIETPGCISHYGGNMDQIPDFDDLDQDVRDNGYHVDAGCYDYWTFKGYGETWVTGGYKTFQATEHVKIDNVRLNDYELRDEHQYDPAQPWLWPASQVGLMLGPMVDSKNQYLNDIRVQNLVIVTTLADGVNMHGSMYDVTVESSYVSNTGDDALATWAGPADIKDVVFKDMTVVNPGVRQGSGVGNAKYSWGSCFAIFGIHSLEIDGLTCYDRYCPTAQEANNQEWWAQMCQEQSNGHVVAVYAPMDHSPGFDGHYFYEGGPDAGNAKITLKNIEWYHMENMYDSHSLQPVESSEPLGYQDEFGTWYRNTDVKRNIIAGTFETADTWTQYKRPVVSLDGGDYKDIFDFDP